MRQGTRSSFISQLPRGELISRRATGGPASGVPQEAQKRAAGLFTRPQRGQALPPVTGSCAGGGCTTGAAEAELGAGCRLPVAIVGTEADEVIGTNHYNVVAQARLNGMAPAGAFTQAQFTFSGYLEDVPTP